MPIPGKQPTQYRPEWHEGQWAWRAEADHSASMWRLGLMPPVPPNALGSVAFSWWVDRLVPGAELQTAGKSDSPARLVLAFAGDRSRLSAKNQMLMDLAEAMTGEAPPYATLVYAWSNDQAPEVVVIHPRSDRIRKIVVEQGAAGLRQWRHYHRNVGQDFQLAFGEPPGELVAVAWMTDADNLGSTALTWYGAVQLEGQPPWAPPPVTTEAAR